MELIMITMTIEEAKNIVAVKHGFDNWNELYWKSSAHELYDYENESMLLHTKHHVEQALKAASECDLECNCDSWESCRNEIPKYSILNAYSIENIK